MRTLKFLFVRYVHDIRLLVQYQQYSHQRFLTLLVTVIVVCVLYSAVKNVFLLKSFQGDPLLDRWCDKEALPSYILMPDPEEITLVTSFFDLGSYKNGPGMLDYSNLYQQKQWMRPMAKIANPIIAYIENEDVAQYFLKIRSCLPSAMTKIIKVTRKELWSFKLLPYIRRIYKKSDYPQHHPNTIYPEYTSASHAKYELLERASKNNYWGTNFFAWIDITYFRNLDETSFDVFKLIPPTSFNVDLVSLSQAWPHDPNVPVKEVIKNNLVWVSGQMILGIREPLLNFTRHYKRTVETLLKDDISGGDEQMIYIMYSTSQRKPNQVMVKTYLCHEGQLNLYGKDSRFLCLGYVCKNAWNRIHKPGL